MGRSIFLVSLKKISLLKVLLFSILLLWNRNVEAQLSIFNGLTKNEVLAQQYIAKGDYNEAVKIYKFLASKKQQPQLYLKLGRLYYMLKKPKETTYYLTKYNENFKLGKDDMMLVIKAYQEQGDIKNTTYYLNRFLKNFPDDNQSLNTLFSLKNQKYYYEDSIHYKVNILNINSTNPDFAPVFFDKKLYYSSQKDSYQLVKSIDALTYAEQTKMYLCDYSVDSLDINQGYDIKDVKKVKEKPFSKKGFWKGTYYNAGKSLAITRQFRTSKHGKKSVGIFFTNYIDEEKQWTDMEPFSFNSLQYIVMDPTFSKDEEVMYFSSNMEGTLGGYDIFMSKKNHESIWTQPVNLGDKVNTTGNEVSPFVHNNNIDLYFSSNGHPGMGGYDIYLVRLYEDFTIQPKNMGYPINSYSDESGFILNTEGNIGFFNSNRKNKGFDEDIYHVKYDMKAYPMEVSVKLEIKKYQYIGPKIEYNNIHLELVEYYSKNTIQELHLQNLDVFNLLIPYSSKYLLKCSVENLDTNTAILEFPMFKKNRNMYYITMFTNYKTEG